MAAVRVEGLREFRRVMIKLEARSGPEIREALRDCAEIVASAARERAPRSAVPRGPHMADTIKATTSGPSAVVRVDRRRVSRGYPAGYPYPRRLEYEAGGARAFLGPALNDNRERVFDRVGVMLDHLAETYGEG